MVAIGTRGDVDPSLAMALALRARGHEVAVATAGNLCAHVRQFGIPAHPICGDLSAITSDPFRALIGLRKSFSEQFHALLPVSDDASAIVGSGFPFPAPTVAEFRRIPYVYAVAAPPYVPESELIPYLGWPAPLWVSRFGWWYQRLSNDFLFRKQLGHCRAGVGMGPAGPVFRDVFQPPLRIFAAPSSMGGRMSKAKGFFTPGFLRLPVEGSLPEKVRRFLDAGPAPLVIALGSSQIANARELVGNVISAAGECGLRTLVASSWSDSLLGNLPDSVCLSPAAPYSLLFERAAAIVHHGGAGTFASALASGKPQVVLPGFADQYYWARMATETGVAPPMIRRSRATRAALLDRIRQAMSEPKYSIRARELKVSEVCSNGAERAAAWLEELVH